MKVLHIASNTLGYEKVELVANRVNRKNHLSVIRYLEPPWEGEEHFTGGFIINDTPQIREALSNIPIADQYEFVKAFKVDPFVRPYLDEPYGEEELKNLNKKQDE